MTRAELRRLWLRERARFARVFPGAERTRLIVADRACPAREHCSMRDLAYAVPGRRPHVMLVARALELPRANVVGLLRHELGHVCDAWIDEAGREQRADDIAAYVAGGQKIRYDRHPARKDVQTVGAGRWPRPRHLHR